MVAHQAIGVDHPVESINRFGQHLQKQRPVGVVPIDILPPVTTRSDMIKAVRGVGVPWRNHIKIGREGKKERPVTSAPVTSHKPARPPECNQQRGMVRLSFRGISSICNARHMRSGNIRLKSASNETSAALKSANTIASAPTNAGGEAGAVTGVSLLIVRAS